LYKLYVRASFSERFLTFGALHLCPVEVENLHASCSGGGRLHQFWFSGAFDFRVRSP